MKINSGLEKQITDLIKSGYTLDSVFLRLSKQNKQLKKSDILIIAKKHNLTFGKKDLTTVKGKMKEAESNLGYAMTQKPIVDKAKKLLWVVFYAIILLMVCVLVIGGTKAFVITAVVVASIIVILLLITYFTVVRGNKDVISSMSKQLKSGSKDKKGSKKK